MAEYTGSVLAIDPSGRGKDETAYAVVKILHGNLYLVASGGFSEGFSEATLKALAVIAKTHSVNEVIIEANFGDGMFSQLFKPVVARIHPVTVEEVKHSVQKERRIADTLEPLMNQHRLIVDRKVIEEDYRTSELNPKVGLIYQLTRLTREKGSLRHDDRLDALSIAVAYWIEHMGRDTEQAAAEHKEALLDKMLEDFAETVLGRQWELRWNLGVPFGHLIHPQVGPEVGLKSVRWSNRNGGSIRVPMCAARHTPGNSYPHSAGS
jgi:hypothetical protein